MFVSQVIADPTKVEQQCPLWRPQQVYIGRDAQDISASRDY